MLFLHSCKPGALTIFFSALRIIWTSSYLHPAIDHKQKALYQQYSFNDLWSASQMFLILNISTLRLPWESWSKGQTGIVPHLNGNCTGDNLLRLLSGENYACLRRMKCICDTDTITNWLMNVKLSRHRC